MPEPLSLKGPKSVTDNLNHYHTTIGNMMMMMMMIILRWH
jgi:hypothetical protein